MASTKNLVVIDTDCGVDDAHAIMIVLNDPNTEVLAITCVKGIVDVDQIFYNVHRVLDVCDRRDIPVYKGAAGALLADGSKCSFHGVDGLGDSAHTKLEIPSSMQHSEHAVDVLVSLANQHPGLITVLAIAPLTNLALAERMAPGFSSKLKEVYIMGGNMYGKGNVNPTGEFNFHHDPEASYITIDTFMCPLILTTWELTMESEVKLELFKKILKTDSKKGRFLAAISDHCYKIVTNEQLKASYGGLESSGWNACDALAACIVLDRAMIVEARDVPCQVSLSGITRGQLVVDWNRFWAKTKLKRRVVTKINMEKYIDFLEKSVR